jgi:phytoene desaturase
MKLNPAGRKVIVIGGGIAGLATSIRLVKSGYSVRLFEANADVGGNIGEIKSNGFRWDTGPSILTKPEYIEELFQLCKKDPKDYIRFQKVEPLFRYFFSDGTSIDTFSDRKLFEAELKIKSNESFTHVNKLLDDSKEIFRLTKEVFLERSLHEFRNYFDLATLRGILRFNRVRAFSSMHKYNRKVFKDKRLVQLFDRYASFNGSNPFEAPATLNVITHFAINNGSWLPEGGMVSIAKSLRKLAMEEGVEIKTSSPVKKIVIENNRVKGIETAAGLVDADIVVSNADIHFTYNKLMPEVKMPGIVESQPRSSSVIVFYWGIKKTFPSLELHNTFFCSDDRKEYDSLFKEHVIPDDPTVYLYNSSKMNTSDAPSGMSNWFVMVSAPYNNGQDWDSIVSKVKMNVLKKISHTLNEDIEPVIVTENMLTPSMIENKTNAWLGSIYGNSSNKIFSAFLRHANFSRKIHGLFFCGGSVHPGAGLPLCLLSAKITSELVMRRTRS